MAENDTTAAERHFSVQRVYIKDASFESPHAPEVFRGEWKPTHELNLGTKVQQLEEAVFEVTLSVTVTAKLEENTAFVVEVQQAGIFAIKGFPDNEMGAMLGAFCPNLLFPYAREVVSDLVVKGSFPQLVLQHVNFEALYAQQRKQALDQMKQDGQGAVQH